MLEQIANGATYAHTSIQLQPVFIVESVPGGFIVSGSGGRQVARNVHAVGRLLREWAPKEPKKEPVPE
jgi:hypothetical protein